MVLGSADAGTGSIGFRTEGVLKTIATWTSAKLTFGAMYLIERARGCDERALCRQRTGDLDTSNALQPRGNKNVRVAFAHPVEPGAWGLFALRLGVDL